MGANTRWLEKEAGNCLHSGNFDALASPGEGLCLKKVLPEEAPARKLLDRVERGC